MEQESDLKKLEMRVEELENELRGLKAGPPIQNVTAEEIKAYLKVRDMLGTCACANRPGATCACANRPGATCACANRPGATCACANRPGATCACANRPGATCACANRPGATCACAN